MASNVLTALKRQVHKIPACKQLHTQIIFLQNATAVWGNENY